MATTSSASSPLDSSPPLLPPISSSDDNGSLADSIAIQSSFTDPLAHNPPAYPIDLDENSDNDADIEPDAGSPTLPPGLGGFRASVGGAEQISEEIEAPTRTLVPIPTVSPEAGTISFAFPNTNDPVTNDLSALSRPLPPESGADIVIAPDKSYVETSSAPWAMELKRRYDTLYGVNVIVRSPYAITAFVGQHGQKRYRIGHRELSAPGASGVVAEDLLVSKHSKSPPPQTSPQSSKTGIANGKRHSRGRISINALLGSGSGPTVPGPSGTSVASTPRKLRKPRSNPDLSLSSATGFSGRMHSLSVTATDMPHVLGIDPSNLSSIPSSSLFTNPTHLANRSAHTNVASYPSATSSTNNSASEPSFIPRPFGPGVHFETPAILHLQHSTRAQRHLREMQSFESGLTATPMPPITPTAPGKFGGSSSDPLRATSSNTRRLEQPELSASQQPRVQLYSPSGLPPRLAKFTTYSTEIFDVLQTSRGLPRLDLLDVVTGEDETNGATIPVKLSLSQDGSAAPKDDPRFVIWGEVVSSEGGNGGDASSVSHESSASNSSSIGIRLGTKGKGRVSDVQSNGIHGTANAKLGSDDGSEKPRVLLAATIERWLAQLTSDLDYDELLNFFLTYRTYVSALDLARLLMTRFCWALGTLHSSNTVNHDDVVRRIVRVRTFVAFKYWLITFFTVDFVPNRELRLFVANNWNDLAKELQALGKESIVKKLKNVAKDCKKLYTHNNSTATSNHPAHNSASQPPSTTANTGKNLFGEKFAEATRKLSAASAHSTIDMDDSDVDLDFIDEPSSSPYSGVYGQTPANNVHLGGASTLNLSTAISPPGPGSIPLSSFSILQRTDHAPGPDIFANSIYNSSLNTTATPIAHNALSRVLVKTLGRLGRWKRVLNSGGVAHGPHSGGGLTRMATACADVSAFDVELTVDSSDLLTSSGGVENYLKLVEGSTPQVPHNQPQTSSLVKISPSVPAAAATSSISNAPHNRESRVTRRSSRTSSTGSFGEPLSANRASARFPAFTSPWQFDVASLDDLSDNSSDEPDATNHRDDAPAAPPGLRRPPRRLPLRREFEFLERPETVSSMGIISRSSIVSASSASGQSTASHASSSSAAGGLGAGIQQWQMNALKDSLMDDEEPGDVEDALKRLEGQINPEKQMEKASKVNGWVKTIRERLAAGDYSDEEPMYSDDEDDIEHEGRSEFKGTSQNTQDSESTSDATPSSPDASLPDAESGNVRTPVMEQTTSPVRTTDAKPAVEDAVPLEIRQSRLSSEAPVVISPVISKFVDPSSRPKATVHRSFVVLFKVEDLAQHFAMIDRELFMTIKFEELLLEEWMFCEEVDTLDWAQFLKDRARWKVESRWPEKTSALGAVRARFNLMVNFTVSEIVLTNPTERSYVFSRFLRIAWKSYQRNSFNTLVAIMTGLQSPWVSKAMRKSMHKLTVWDNRMLTDLRLFTSRKDNFKHIRSAVDAINDLKPPEASAHAPSVGSATGSVIDQTPPACIPFMGTYLSQLHQYNQLPPLIDPTAPNEVVTYDPVSSNLSSPAHPHVFSTLAPLPSSMHLEPLINVHRQRLIAAVIKSLVAGQHLASRVQFPIDKKLFHKCLRIRGLDSATLQRALGH
ncbi:hypothetical protein EV360DRAFT_49174 [Lentinula raphanica]|nr:hypothetical protein EV360DRAFT_49174 [Lentinula raphanica]